MATAASAMQGAGGPVAALASHLTSQEQLPPRSQASSPEITAGHVVPLLESNVARPLRYTPRNSGFSIQNGTEFFNRPLYGPNVPFRVDGGDLPEFSLYLPGHGGNLRLGISLNGRSVWLQECASVETEALAGRLSYQLRDPLLGPRGSVSVQALTCGTALWLEVSCTGLPPAAELVWAFGGVSGRKGRRNGDIGCEEEPVSRFFQLRPEECRGNVWSLCSQDAVAKVVHGGIELTASFPPGAELALSDAAWWNRGWQTLWEKASSAPSLPVLVGHVALRSEPQYLEVQVVAGTVPVPGQALGDAIPRPATFAARRQELAAVAGALRWTTPDPFLDSMSGALGIAADALWDETQGCVMHGAVAWRIPLAGWRGPYILDVTGRHDRMRRNVRHWVARQNGSAVSNGSGGQPTPAGWNGVVEAQGAPDPGSHDSRTEHLLHSNGDVSHNHYDMNLVFFDAVLRHLRWTGDLELAREVWPALERHCAFERRLFRRDYGTRGKSLPLYEAYAAIWASDNLQYNGGGAAHSSAYNVFLNRGMAALADALGNPGDALTYRAEADSIGAALREVLWMREQGALAESREWLGECRLATSPALWTVYHTIDSEAATPREAWQMLAERLRVLRRIPVCGTDVPDDAGWQLSCSDWMPYVWSLTLLCPGEMLHTALAMFQAGMAEDGYKLLRGTLLDAGFRGLCPGNFPMSLQMDPHRQESQRDFGDPIGCAGRAIVEGLWGVQPDLLQGRLHLSPQLPPGWREAELQHPELTLTCHRSNRRETWQIDSRFGKALRLVLKVRARGVAVPRVLIDGEPGAATFLPDAVGEPRLLVEPPQPATRWTIDIDWHGPEPVRAPRQPLACVVGQPVPWPAGVHHERLDDPQGCLAEGVPVRSGGFCVFSLQQHGSCAYWLPVELAVAEVSRRESASAARHDAAPPRIVPVSQSDAFDGHLTAILRRSYDQPRSGLCSLNLPDGLLGGWANFDSTASIDDSGLRRADLTLPNGAVFRTRIPDGPNCIFLSHWQGDRTRLNLPVQRRVRAVYLLVAATTFPQASRTAHLSAVLHYEDGSGSVMHELRSPDHWWPVEQDYLLDDYVFRLSEQPSPGLDVPWRVDLGSGNVRATPTGPQRGGPVPGGAAFVVKLQADPGRVLAALELRILLYGPVLAFLGASLEMS